MAAMDDHENGRRAMRMSLTNSSFRNHQADFIAALAGRRAGGAPTSRALASGGSAHGPPPSRRRDRNEVATFGPAAAASHRTAHRCSPRGVAFLTFNRSLPTVPIPLLPPDD